MKKPTKFPFLLLASALLGLSACGNSAPSSAESEPELTSDSSVATTEEISSSAEATTSEASEDYHESTNKYVYYTKRDVEDEDWVSYAEDYQCQLNLDFEGRDFWEDGIEKVSLLTVIDGDTAHFTTSSGRTLKSRFYGIDTPESTGQVQPWGKPASKFTKEVLNYASIHGAIVVSSAQDDYGSPQADSTGSRYVSLVWVSLDNKNPAYDELILVNLMIVEFGLSNVKSVNSMPQYADTFYAAERQANAYGVNMWSGAPDPFFNYGDYEDISLLDLKREVVHKYNDDSYQIIYDNAKVRVQGTVAGFANHIIYIVDFCYYYNKDGEKIYKSTGEINEDGELIQGETGEYAGINIFAGMSTIPSKFTTIGNYIQVSGLVQDGDFGFQITSARFKTIAYDENDASVILYADENTDVHALHTFEYTAEELSALCRAKDYVALNCRVRVTNPTTITGFFDSESGPIYLYSSQAWSVYFNFTFKPYPNDSSVSWNTGERFVGHQFLFEGVLAVHRTTTGKNMLYMYPGVTRDITWVDTDAPAE